MKAKVPTTIDFMKFKRASIEFINACVEVPEDKRVEIESGDVDTETGILSCTFSFINRPKDEC